MVNCFISTIGIILLFFGFFIQPLSQETIPAQLVFWLGFYIILRFGIIFEFMQNIFF